MLTRAKWVTGSALGALLVLSGAAAAYSEHYDDLGLPGVSVAGESVTGQSRQDVVDEVARRAEDIAVTVVVDGHTTVSTLSDLGWSVDAEATADTVFGPNASVVSRISALASPHDFPAVVTADRDVLTAFAQKISAEVGPAVQDATVQVNDAGTNFVATEAHAGVGIDVATLEDAAQQAATSLTSTDVDCESHQVDPAITTDQARQAAERANALLDLDVSANGTTSRNPASRADMASWVTIPRTESGLGEPVFDAAKVTEWVHTVADTTNEPPVNGITNVNANGDDLVVAWPGKTGYMASNVDAVAADAVNAVQAGKDFEGQFEYDEVEPTYEKRQALPDAENLIYPAAEGEKWIDVDLSKHSVTAYEGDRIVHGPVLMVDGKPGHETVTGTFHVQTKHTSIDMGCTPGWDYCTKGVPWVSFFNGSYGLHGADWRSTWGFAGRNGSHGCVNMPVGEAKWIFDWDEVGTPVVSHY